MMHSEVYLCQPLAHDFDPTKRQHVKFVLAQLLSNIPFDPPSARAWFKLFCDASDSLSEYQTELEIRSALDTSNIETREAIEFFENEILCLLLNSRIDLMSIYLQSPWKNSMHADDRGMVEKDFTIRAKKNNGSLSALQLEENVLVRRYKDFILNARTSFLAKDVPLSIVVGKLNERNENMRKNAFMTYWSFVKDNEHFYQELFSELQNVREKQAQASSSRTYEDFIYADFGRHDFSSTDCERLREEIITHIVPIMTEISIAQSRTLSPREEEFSGIKPWNVRFWSDFFPKSAPSQFSASQLLSDFQKATASLGIEIQQCHQALIKNQSIDVFPRAGKAPGAFCALRPLSGTPFIFGNFSVSVKDLYTLFHEFGHAAHGYLSACIQNTLLRSPGLEFCEFISTSFEFLAQNLMNHFWTDSNEALLAKRFHQFHSLAFLPFAAQIDHWQSRIYASGRTSCASERNKLWSELSDQYRPQIDWSGIEDFKELGWCSRPHIFTSPFYYIDYAIAQIGAWQISAQSETNLNLTIKNLVHAMSLGGQRSMNELFKSAGVASPFMPDTCKNVAQLIRKTFKDELNREN